jgi:hypothetical protein
MKLSLIAALLLSTAAFAAPRLVVVLKTGVQAETDVSAIAKVTFSASAVTVHASDGKTASTPLDQIQRMHFATGSPVRGFSRADGTPGLLLPDADGARLRLDGSTRVEAALLRLDGSRVRDLGTFVLHAGSHRLSWAGGDGPALEGGVYLLQVRLEGRAPERALIRWMP